MRDLRHTHDEVCFVFRHGPHKGQSVDGLVRQLIDGYPVDAITPLVVVVCQKIHWVVFGNRRLKALKDFSRVTRKRVSMKCIVHDLDEPRKLVPWTS